MLQPSSDAVSDAHNSITSDWKGNTASSRIRCGFHFIHIELLSCTQTVVAHIRLLELVKTWQLSMSATGCTYKMWGGAVQESK